MVKTGKGLALEMAGARKRWSHLEVNKRDEANTKVFSRLLAIQKMNIPLEKRGVEAEGARLGRCGISCSLKFLKVARRIDDC